MKKTAALIALLLVANVWMAASCNKTTSVNATLFNSETLAVDSATAATQTFKLYATQAIQADPASQAKIQSQLDEVYGADRQIAATLATIDGLRLAMKTDPNNTTNAASLQIALSAASTQSSNIVSLVKMFMSK